MPENKAEGRLPNNYDLVMSNMTIDLMAEKNVRLVNINNNQLFWLTSVGQLFDYNSYQAAIQFELNWLSQPLQVQTPPTSQPYENNDDGDDVDTTEDTKDSKPKK